MAERLIGVETEYALAAVGPRGGRANNGQVLDGLMRNVRHRFRHLPDASRGVFLENGARFYIDLGGHPEMTTPECSNPWDVVRYIRAGESVLLQLVDERTALFRSNACYHTGAVWGTHDNFMHSADPRVLPRQIIPHLVSRIVYTGAGGFQNQSPGLEFTLSPRVAHLEAPVSHDSTSGRGIFHSKDEDLCDGRYHRLHVLSGESLCSELATWLRVGTTALVVALCEAGLRPGGPVVLRDPVRAMRVFAADPTCRAVVDGVGGRRLGALAIQHHYLRLAEAHVADDFMPSWAPEVCRRWRGVLEALESGWEAMATTLDWPIKLALYRDHARRCGVPWESFQTWTLVVERLTAALHRTRPTRPLTPAVALARDSPIAADVEALNGLLREAGLDWSGFEPFLRLRDALREIDTRFAQLGIRGIFASLDAAGALTHRVAGIDHIDHAVTHPPDVPRARLRGELVRELSGGGSYECDWNVVFDVDRGKFVDLSDPFAATREWKDREDAILSRRGGLGLDPQDPISLNQAALAHRHLNRLEEAERLLREAIVIEDARVRADSPKRPHRRNNLSVVLMRAGKLDEAVQLNAEAWRLKAGRHDLTSGRILFVRIALVLLGDLGEVGHYVGQLKSLLGDEPLQCDGNIMPTWDISDVLHMLRQVLREREAKLLEEISNVLNEGGVRALEDLEMWREAEVVELEEEWPAVTR